MKRMLIVLSVFGLFLGACGGGDDKESTSAGDTASETASETANESGDEEADGALKAKLLAESDLPEGFEIGEATESDPAESDEEGDDDFCPELAQLDEDHPGERDAEVDFQRQSGDDATSASAVSLNQQLSRFADDDAAADAFEAFESGFPKCDNFTQTEDDGSTITGKFTKTSFPDVGDDTYAAKMTLSQGSGAEAIALEGHFIVVREGRYIMLLMTVGLGDELTEDELEAVAKKAVAKV